MIRDTLIHPNAALTSMVKRVRRRVFGLSLEEATFARRGFPATDPVAQQRLEQIGRTFLHGYHAALEDDETTLLLSRLNAIDGELRGFAFEGAAMALTILDGLTPWQNRLAAFVRSPGSAHVYMSYVGAGWAYARLHRRLDRALRHLDPLLGWLSVDGFGFHEGYFHWQRSIQQQRVPAQLTSYGLRAFDQGLGRSIWFVGGADPQRVIGLIAQFPSARHSDLWSGVGLACTYAGCADQDGLRLLRTAAGQYMPHMAQGASFAAKTRQRAGNLTAHTDLACHILCELPASEAADITDHALENLSFTGPIPAYELWRQRIQASFPVKEIS